MIIKKLSSEIIEEFTVRNQGFIARYNCVTVGKDKWHVRITNTCGNGECLLDTIIEGNKDDCEKAVTIRIHDFMKMNGYK